MACHLPGSAPASSETGALCEFCLTTLSSPGCTHIYMRTSTRTLCVCLCGLGIVLNSVDLIVLSAQFVPQISSVGVKCSVVYPYILIVVRVQ